MKCKTDEALNQFPRFLMYVLGKGRHTKHAWQMPRLLLRRVQRSALQLPLLLVAMTHLLSFVLSNEGVARVYDAVTCLAKFGDLVSLDARRDKVSVCKGISRSSDLNNS